MIDVGTMKLTIQHGNYLFEPPIESGIKIEWERTNAPGKMTFTTLKLNEGGFSFSEGDVVRFYYNDKPMFFGYVFSKKRNKNGFIEVTCYDQIRYLKNKFTYIFENKTATQIIQALCKDFNLITGDMENTPYVIPSLIKENTSALDIIFGVLEDTLVNTGQMYVMYDDGGKLYLKNTVNMMSNVLICDDTAENFDYSTSIDEETYNNIVLYYKDENNGIKVYTSSDGNNIKKWGELRYFEEVKNQTSAQNKANSLLKIYNRKTRELKIKGAFGIPDIRGGSMIPIRIDLGDIVTNNFMLVEKVTHNFEKDKYTMDLQLEGAWDE